MTFVVGLTGGIGSGKSLVAKLFAALGAGVVDTDAISHQLTQAGGAAIAPIREAFGEGMVNAQGALDRGRMRAEIFSGGAVGRCANDDARKKLEAILHPLIRAEALRLTHAALAGGAPYVLLVVPLLFETGGYRELLSRSLLVDCDEATQITRAAARDGLDPGMVRAIMSAQLAREQRRRLADDVIDNDAGLDTLQQQVASLHHQYVLLAQ